MSTFPPVPHVTRTTDPEFIVRLVWFKEDYRLLDASNRTLLSSDYYLTPFLLEAVRFARKNGFVFEREETFCCDYVDEYKGWTKFHVPVYVENRGTITLKSTQHLHYFHIQRPTHHAMLYRDENDVYSIRHSNSDRWEPEGEYTTKYTSEPSARNHLYRVIDRERIRAFL